MSSSGPLVLGGILYHFVRPALCLVHISDLLYSLRQESQIWCVDASWDCGVSHITFGSLRP